MTTRNYVPNDHNEGEIGVEKKWWAKGYFVNLNTTNIKSDAINIRDVEATNANINTVNTDNMKTKLLIFNGMEVSFSFIKRNTLYKVDDIAYNKNTQNGIRLECVKGGTTANEEPEEYSTSDIGTYIIDGETKWIVCDIKDGLPYGDVAYRPILKEGYVKLNGATVQRNDYPRLVKYATDNNLWTSSPMTEVWKFGQGDGSTTFVLPDYRNIFLEGGDTPSKIEAGLPNIQGNFYANDISSLFWTGAKQATGAFSLNTTQKNVFSGTATALLSTTSAVLFNASSYNAIYGKSNTVQPPSIKLIPQIKY